MNVEHTEFIDALGGTGALVVITGMPANRISNWKQRGIPWKWRNELARRAKRKKIPLPEGFFKP